MSAPALKDALTAQQLFWVEDSLTNDENTPDEEMLSAFEGWGLTPDQAKEALTYRPDYLLNMFHEDHTPLKVGRDQAQAFDPHTKSFSQKTVKRASRRPR